MKWVQGAINWRLADWSDAIDIQAERVIDNHQIVQECDDEYWRKIERWWAEWVIQRAKDGKIGSF